MMKKQNKIYLGIGIVAVVLIVAIVIFSNQNKEEETIKIGAIYPLTGIYSSYGLEYKRGLEIAVDEINSQGGINKKQIELIIEDDSGDVTKSVTATNKLINLDKVNYLFTAFSSTSQATSPIAERNKIIYISATVSKIGTGNYVFRDFWDIEDQGVVIGESLNNEGIKKLGVLAMNYGDTEYFLNALKSKATNVEMIEERFNFGDTDFKTQLTKIKNLGAEAILVYAFPGAEATKITQQLIELKLDNKRLYAGATTYGLPFMYEPFSDTLIKMKAIDSWYSLDLNNVKSTEFAQKYKLKYNQDLVGDAAYPYDDMYALKTAMEKAATTTDTSKVAKELRKIDMNGAAGRLFFDENGNSKRSAYLQIYTSDGWKKYE